MRWLLVVVALAAGCGDDRKRVAETVFRCDPTSPTADFDCGPGHLCYSAAQALGGSFCAPECKPSDPRSCPDGTCSIGGACLRNCRIDKDNCGSDASPLHCVRTTINPRPDGTDGLCILVGETCGKSAECSSPVYDSCTSEILVGANDTSSGNTCLQGGCQRRGVACLPGSTCIPRLLGITDSRVPDVCTPNCERREVEGKTVNECVIGFGCLSDIYPQSRARACAPGFPGWLCTHNVACITGRCVSFEDVDPRMAELRVCAGECTSDDDCLAYDEQFGGQSFFTKMTCRGGFCRALGSTFFPEQCLDMGKPGACLLDPAAECLAQTIPGPQMGLLGSCQRKCAGDADCEMLSTNTHVPHVCDQGLCTVALPFFAGCRTDAQCLAGLSCMPTPIGSQCTKSCASSQDCAATPSLGSVFACFAGICIPRTGPTQAPPAPVADLCLGGLIVDGKCVSPRGWYCDIDAECASGDCSPAKRCE